MLEQEKYIFEAMENIDRDLEMRGVKLSDRPLMAAMEFVRLFVLDVSHGDKDAPWNEPWFAIISHHVRDWYQKTYGDALESEKNNFVGVVLIRSLPYELKIPHTRHEIETEGERIWVVFPSGVDDAETPFDWLVNPPNIDRLSDEATTDLRAQISYVTSALRQISANLGTTTKIEGDFSGFISGIQTELESAARNIIKNTPDSLQIAVWSIQMAMERTLKAISIQQRTEYRESHDLFVLFDDLEGVDNVAPRDLLKILPRQKQAVSARYGHSPDLRLSNLTDTYRAAIEFIRLATSMFERKVKISNARFLIQKPPWLELPSGENGSGRNDA